MVYKRALAENISRFAAAALCQLILAALCFGQDPSGRPTAPSNKRPTKRPAAKTETQPQPITVILTVLTDPPESTVLINGEERGTTNAEGRIQIEKLPLGRYTVEVRKEGYATALRPFQAGAETPTLVIKLEPDFSLVAKEFDSLVEAGKLYGPESPNALELVELVSQKYSARPELARMRGVLASKLSESVSKTVDRTMSSWRAVTSEELTQSKDAAQHAAKLKDDDKRLQAQAAYMGGALALREWQSAGAQATDAAQPQNAEAASSGSLATARSEFEKAAGLDDSWAAARYQLGLVLLNSGDATGAEAAFLKVTQLEPRWAIAYAGLGSAYHAAGKYKEAIAAFRKAIEIDPNYAAAYAGLGLARAMKGETKDGIKDIERAMQLDQASGLPHLNLGIVYSKSKKSKELDRAAEELQKAIEKNSANVEFQNSTAQQLLADLQKRKRK